MILCTAFKRFMDTGNTKPFLVTSDTGQTLVIKAHGNPQGNKSLFNELVAGRLAALLGLPWPRVSVAKLSDEVMSTLAEGGARPTSPLAVCTAFVDSLQCVSWPEGGYVPGPEFAQKNAEHICKIIPASDNRDPLYGKMIYDNWVLLKDTKYETLYLDANGKPIFLDASIAFGGIDWDEKLLVWNNTAFDIQSPYLEGVLTDQNRFRPWLDRLQALPMPAIEECFFDYPREWLVPENYVKKVVELFKTTSQTFMPQFDEWLSWKEYSRGCSADF